MNAGDRALTRGVVHLWLAFESQLDDPSTAASYGAFMSDEERERERKFLVDGARRLHVLARALQRVVLASYLPDVDPTRLCFVRTATGRPSLAPPFDASGIEFNLAHTRGLVVLAVGSGPGSVSTSSGCRKTFRSRRRAAISRPRKCRPSMRCPRRQGLDSSCGYGRSRSLTSRPSVPESRAASAA